MKQKAFHIILSALWLVSLAGCNLPANKAAAGQISPIGTHAWFDFPVDGMVLALKPYELVTNVTDPGGIAQVEWSINGNVVATTGVDQAANTFDNLSEFHYPWTPEEPGEYTLTVRAQANSGGWSRPARVVVTIPGEATGTYTPTVTATMETITPSNTPTVTTTVTPTSTETATVTPTKDGKLALVDNTKSSDNFYYGSCTPNSITVTVRATQPKMVTYMYLFFSLQEKNGNEKTKSNGGTPMQKVGEDTWSLTVNANQIEDYKRFNEAWFIYQFIAQGGSEVVARSKPFSDVTLSSCGSAPAEPARGITITPKKILTPLWE